MLLQSVTLSLIGGNLCARRVFRELGHPVASRCRSEQHHEVGGDEARGGRGGAHKGHDRIRLVGPQNFSEAQNEKSSAEISPVLKLMRTRSTILRAYSAQDSPRPRVMPRIPVHMLSPTPSGVLQTACPLPYTAKRSPSFRSKQRC
jgi:hypothetical protein